jgi:cytoskeletal protein CcmA (bactofilin family)
MALKGLVARSIHGATGTSTNAAAIAGAPSERSTEASRPILAQAAGPRTVAPSTSVDASSDFEGRLRCKETLRIDGRIQGEIECEKIVIVGEGARVHACVDADEVQVSGIVEGDITARRKITLECTAVVVGDLVTPGIVIQEGAKLKGRILIGSDAAAEETVKATRDAKSDAASTEAGGSSTSSTKKSSKSAGSRPDTPKTEQAAASPA